MQKTKSWRKISKIGKIVQKRWGQIFKKFDLDVQLRLPSLSSFVFKSEKHQVCNIHNSRNVKEKYPS